MIVTDEASARILAASWAGRPARLRAFARDQRTCAILCGDRLPETRRGHEAAARVLDEAAERAERNRT